MHDYNIGMGVAYPIASQPDMLAARFMELERKIQELHFAIGSIKDSLSLMTTYFEKGLEYTRIEQLAQANPLVKDALDNLLTVKKLIESGDK